MTHDVSIVMITWADTTQRLDALKKSLTSIKSCTKIPHRLVVVDNGPSQQTKFLNTQDIDILLTQKINIGIGAARNLGAAATKSEYIAFVDNDIEYFAKWLKAGCDVLARKRRWPVLITPRKSSPMKFPKHHIGKLGEYQIYNRCSGQCIIMRRKDFNEIGQWATHSKPGGDYCDKARELGYFYAWNPDWNAKHICKKASYNHRQKLVNGVWVNE